MSRPLLAADRPSLRRTRGLRPDATGRRDVSGSAGRNNVLLDPSTIRADELACLCCDELTLRVPSDMRRPALALAGAVTLLVEIVMRSIVCSKLVDNELCLCVVEPLVSGTASVMLAWLLHVNVNVGTAHKVEAVFNVDDELQSSSIH